MTLETVLYSKILIQSSSLVPIAIHALDVMSVLCVEVYLESHVSEVPLCTRHLSYTYV